MYATLLLCSIAKRTSLKLKTSPKQLFGCLPLYVTTPEWRFIDNAANFAYVNEPQEMNPKMQTLPSKIN